MSAGNVWFEQDRFGKKVALNTKIVPVDNDSFVQTFARFLLEQSFIFNCCTKGQLISKCLFGVFNFFQMKNENTPHTKGQIKPKAD